MRDHIASSFPFPANSADTETCMGVCVSTIISASISVEKISRYKMNSSASIYSFLN